MEQDLTPLRFIHDLKYDRLSVSVKKRTKHCLLDLIGIAIAGSNTKLSSIICRHAAREFGGTIPIAFDEQTASPSGVALALGMTIDSLDGHDGFNPSKGHIGCGVIAALLSFAKVNPNISGPEFLARLVMGYEIGARLGITLHDSVADYHTSGAWVSVASAAIGARSLGLNEDQTKHALGIAEYHGPRSQMMRCIDHPTMLKDGSGWGAMAGVSASYLAHDGFTGAPAITMEICSPVWRDLGQKWYIMDQYFKPYPVCRWAQAPIEAILDLRRSHSLSARNVERIEIESFHECVRLAIKRPASTEEAQYSTSFPCAVALVRGTVGAADIADDALDDSEIIRLSEGLVMSEDAAANSAFPARRLARARLYLYDGNVLESQWHTPRWDAVDPPTDKELRDKFYALAVPVVGQSRANAIEEAINTLPQDGPTKLLGLIKQPVKSFQK